MKRIIFVLLVASIFASCTSRSGNLSANHRKVRVRELILVNNVFVPIDSIVEIKYVDILYKAGDQVNLGEGYYLILP